MVLVMWRQRRWSQVVGVVVMVEVRSSVGIWTALVKRVSRGRRRVKMVGEVRLRTLQHRQPCPPALFKPASASPSSPRSAVEAGGVHGD